MTHDTLYTPSLDELQMVRDQYELSEARNVFYRSAIELIRLAKEGAATVSTGDALSGLLLTLNRQFYRFRSVLLLTSPDDLESLLKKHGEVLEHFSTRTIEGLRTDNDT